MENTSVHSLADEISPLTLAFVGDGVYDLLVREYLVRKANRSVGELNKIKVSLPPLRPSGAPRTATTPPARNMPRHGNRCRR